MYYTPTFTDQLDEDYISHHGIKGMKWGVRRYQNYDGTRTSKGLARDRANSKKRRGLSNRTKQNLKTAAKIAGATAIGAASLYAINKMGTPKYNADDFAGYGARARAARDQMYDRAWRATEAANATQSARTGRTGRTSAQTSQKRQSEYDRAVNDEREYREKNRKATDEAYARWESQRDRRQDPDSEAAKRERANSGQQQQNRRSDEDVWRDYYAKRAREQAEEYRKRKQQGPEQQRQQQEQQQRRQQQNQRQQQEQQRRSQQQQQQNAKRGSSSDENVDRQHAPENIYAARERARRQAAEAEKQRQREAQKAKSVQQGKSTYDDLIRKHGETKAREVAKQNLDDARRVAEVQKRIAEAEKTGSRNAALNEEFQRAREARRVASDVYNKFGSDQ